jgi:hypothetical protein
MAFSKSLKTTGHACVSPTGSSCIVVFFLVDWTPFSWIRYLEPAIESYPHLCLVQWWDYYLPYKAGIDNYFSTTTTREWLK